MPTSSASSAGRAQRGSSPSAGRRATGAGVGCASELVAARSASSARASRDSAASRRGRSGTWRSVGHGVGCGRSDGVAAWRGARLRARKTHGAEQDEAQDGRGEVRGDEDARARARGAGSVDGACSSGERAAGERRAPSAKTTRPCSWCGRALVAAADAEGEPTVGGGVADRGEQQRERRSRPARRIGAAQRDEEQRGRRAC